MGVLNISLVRCKDNSSSLVCSRNLCWQDIKTGTNSSFFALIHSTLENAVHKWLSWYILKR